MDNNKLALQFGNLLKEDVETALPSPGNAEVGLLTSEETRNFELMNSFLWGFNDSPTINPYYLIQRVRDRLKVSTGLTFGDVYFTGGAGSIDKVLKPIDGINAHTFSGEPVIDNGFLNKFTGTHGLKIHFQFVKVGNLYNVHVEIKPAVGNSAPGKVFEKKV